MPCGLAERRYDGAVQAVFEGLAAQDLPDHEKAGYSQGDFLERGLGSCASIANACGNLSRAAMATRRA